MVVRSHCPALAGKLFQTAPGFDNVPSTRMLIPLSGMLRNTLPAMDKPEPPRGAPKIAGHQTCATCQSSESRCVFVNTVGTSNRSSIPRPDNQPETSGVLAICLHQTASDRTEETKSGSGSPRISRFWRIEGTAKNRCKKRLELGHRDWPARHYHPRILCAKDAAPRCALPNQRS